MDLDQPDAVAAEQKSGNIRGFLSAAMCLIVCLLYVNLFFLDRMYEKEKCSPTDHHAHEDYIYLYLIKRPILNVVGISLLGNNSLRLEHCFELPTLMAS